MARMYFKVSEDDDDVGYLYLPQHPRIIQSQSGKTVKQIRLIEIIEDYKGPDVILDFNIENVLVGIEILL